MLVFLVVKNTILLSLHFCLQDEVQYAMLHCTIIEYFVFVLVSQFELLLTRLLDFYSRFVSVKLILDLIVHVARFSLVCPVFPKK